jgi:hypothetical protein
MSQPFAQADLGTEAADACQVSRSPAIPAIGEPPTQKKNLGQLGGGSQSHVHDFEDGLFPRVVPFFEGKSDVTVRRIRWKAVLIHLKGLLTIQIRIYLYLFMIE